MRSLAGKRKKASPGPQLAGGPFAGVVVTDPAGRATALPFTPGGTTRYLREDGSFDEPAGTGGGGGGGSLADVFFAPLTTGGEPIEFISDGDGRSVQAPWSAA